MARETERGGLLKYDASEPADVELYNDNIDRIHDEVMSVPFSATDPPTLNTWPGKLVLRDSGDPALFLPDLRVNKADNFWERAISGSWEAYTPATMNVTVGNGTLLGRFVHVGSLLHCEILLIWGSTTAFTGAPSFGTPNNFDLRTPEQFTFELRAGLGTWTARAGAANDRYKGRVIRNSDAIDIIPRTNSIPAAALSATLPNTWQNGNKLHIQISGEAIWS